MNETVILDLPDQITQRARRVAAHTQQRLEDVLLDWLAQSAQDVPVELLDDDQILMQANAQLNTEQQAELSSLLESNREAHLDPRDLARLEELMAVYRQGLVRKAQAIHIAVKRGLMPPLN